MELKEAKQILNKKGFQLLDESRPRPWRQHPSKRNEDEYDKLSDKDDNVNEVNTKLRNAVLKSMIEHFNKMGFTKPINQGGSVKCNINDTLYKTLKKSLNLKELGIFELDSYKNVPYLLGATYKIEQILTKDIKDTTHYSKYFSVNKEDIDEFIENIAEFSNKESTDSPSTEDISQLLKDNDIKSFFKPYKGKYVFDAEKLGSFLENLGVYPSENKWLYDFECYTILDQIVLGGENSDTAHRLNKLLKIDLNIDVENYFTAEDKKLVKIVTNYNKNYK